MTHAGSVPPDGTDPVRLAEYPKAPNRYRVAGPFVDLTFGLVAVDWDAASAPLVTTKVVGVHGRTAFEEAVALNALEPQE